MEPVRLRFFLRDILQDILDLMCGEILFGKGFAVLLEELAGLPRAVLRQAQLVGQADNAIVGRIVAQGLA